MIRTIAVLAAFTITVHVGLCDEAQDLAKNRLFHVSVEGVAAGDSSKANPSTTRLAGKAFAVPPGVLITAGHVVEDTRFWRNKGTPGGVAVPDRKVTVSWMIDYGLGVDPKSSADFYVTSSAVDTADVAILVVPQSVNAELELFQLSTKPIDRDSGSYHSLLVRDRPSGEVSIKNPTIVDLEPIGHSEIYPGMYVFGIDTSRQIQRGDSGSPVLDDENRVVGLISGRTQEGQVLVTLASSLERSSLMLHQRTERQAAHIVEQADRIDELTEQVETLQSALDRLTVPVDVVTAQIVAYTRDQNVAESWKDLTRYSVSSVPEPEKIFEIDRSAIDCKPGYEPVAAWTEITGSYPSIDVMYTVAASVTDNGEVTITLRARKDRQGYAYIDVLLLCRPV